MSGPALHLPCNLYQDTGFDQDGVLSVTVSDALDGRRAVLIEWKRNDAESVQDFRLAVDASNGFSAEWVDDGHQLFGLMKRCSPDEDRTLLALFRTTAEQQAIEFIEALNSACKPDAQDTEIKQKTDCDVGPNNEGKKADEQEILLQGQQLGTGLLTINPQPSVPSSTGRHQTAAHDFDWLIPPPVSLQSILKPRCFDSLLHNEEASAQLIALLPESQQTLEGLKSAFKCSQLRSCINLLNEAVYGGNVESLLHLMGVHSIEPQPDLCVYYNRPRPMTQFITSLITH